MNRQKIMQLAQSALPSVWISGALTWAAFSAFGVSAFPQLIAVLAVSALFCALVSLNRITAIVASLAAAGTGAAFVLLNLQTLRQYVQSAAGGTANLHSVPVLLVLAAVWCVLLFATTHTGSSGFLAAVLVLLYWMMLRAFDGTPAFWPMMLALAGVAALFAVPVNGTSNYAKALLPLGLLAALAAMLVLPAEGTVWKPLADAAETARSLFDAYFSFTDTRVPYSIYMDGYQPLGDTLGGPADPSEAAVMEVETDTDLYLRGSIWKTYVNTAWTNATANNRYLYADLLKQSVRSEIFGTDTASGEEAFTRVDADVRMLKEGTSTLFVPHRLSDLATSLELAVYYNSTGEVFITRNVEEGDSYSLSATVQTMDPAVLREVTAAHAEDDDSRFAEIAGVYLQLPKYIERGVYTLTSDITAGCETPYEKAAAIEKWLESNCRYTLVPSMPRKDIDFVSDFVLNTREGYCSYYASAMAVMCRIAGIPTRYIEGYRVAAQPGGTTVVTGKSAHAWVECYFNGIGWITFDPTPGTGTPQSDGASETSLSGSGGDTPSGDEQEKFETGDKPENGGEPETTLPPEDGTVTPEPPSEGEEGATPEPPEEASTPEPTDDAGEDSEPTVPPLEASEEPTEAPTDNPADAPSSEPTQPPQPPQNDQQDPLWMTVLKVLLGILLLAAILAAVIRMRLAATEPEHVIRRYRRSISMQTMVYCRAILTMLESLGQVPESGESLLHFAQRLVSGNIADDSLAVFFERIYTCQYSGRGEEPGDIALGRTAYRELEKRLKRGEKLHWHFGRLHHGIGDPEQIP